MLLCATLEKHVRHLEPLGLETLQEDFNLNPPGTSTEGSTAEFSVIKL